MNFAELIEAAKQSRPTVDQVDDLARLAQQHGEEELALPLVEAEAAKQRSAHLWQWAAVLHRALDDREAALHALAKAEALDPRDTQILRSKARISLEAGLPAVDLFAAAVQTVLNDSDLLLGLVAALFAEGDADNAITGLESMLARQPAWTAGHRDLAQLYCLTGQRERLAESVERALVQLPSDVGLWTVLVDLHAQAEQFDALRDAAERGQKAIGQFEYLKLGEAVAHSELGDIAGADELFREIGNVDDAATALNLVRHDLRNGRIDQALPLIDQWTQSDDRAAFWPYASIAWRLSGDPRADWLNGDFVRAIDLGDRLHDLDGLAAHLRTLHVAKARHLDQSVRGGTQTDGALFARIEPPIKALRSVIADVLPDYVNALPAVDHNHPLLSHRRDRKPRFAGSWSVRLTGAGFHSNHVHPAGWISSALYISLPDEANRGSGDAGWLVLGEPQDQLNIALEPTDKVEPRQARLVLFPSYMWHGTRPFEAGERLSVAFDVAPPAP